MKILYAKYELDRRPECRIETRVIEEGGRRTRTVRALGAAAEPHIARMAAHHALLEKALAPGGPVALPNLLNVRQDAASWEDIPGPALAGGIAASVLERNAGALDARLAEYRRLLEEGFMTVRGFSPPAPENDFFRGVDISALAGERSFAGVTCADATPDRLVFDGRRHWLVAPEWLIGHGYPVAFVLVRGVRSAVIPNPADAGPGDTERAMSALLRLGIKAGVIEACLRLNEHLESWIRTGADPAPNQAVASLRKGEREEGRGDRGEYPISHKEYPTSKDEGIGYRG